MIMEIKRIIDCPCLPIMESDVDSFFINNISNKGYTVAINAEKILRYKSNVELKEIIDNSIFPYPDGAGAVISLNWLYGMKSEKINMPILSLEYANKNKTKTFIAGADADMHNKAINMINKIYPNIKLVGNMHGFNEEIEIMKGIERSKPDLILLALGSPRQEILAAKIVRKIEHGIVVGCGGALDIIAGKIKRAPKFMIDNNLEWAYRIMQEPWRIKRQFFLPKFFFLLLLEVVKNFFGKGNLENK